MTMTAHQRYETLTTLRDPFLRRAREASRLTLPGLVPEEGSTGTTNLPTPFQSVGARGVNNLTSKLMLALFPPGSAFFRHQLDPKITDEARKAGEDVETALEEALARYEQAIMDHFESTVYRSVIHSTLRHLVVAGNGCLQFLKGGGSKLHPLDSYVVKRDAEGTVLEVVIREGLSPMTLPPAVAAIVEGKTSRLERPNDKNADQKTIYLYTRASRTEDGKWEIMQECLDTEVPGTRGIVKTAPFLPLRWSIVEGEDYGRGHVEEYLGDLASLESLSQSIVEFAAAASKIVFLVDEAGVTDVRDLEEADSGSFVHGLARDVTALQMEKYADFQVANAVAERVEKRLEQAFLLTSSVQRNAERVTAEEIRLMAGELEQALGGIYSSLSSELQRPLVEHLVAQLSSAKKLPKLPEKAVSAKIVTGLEGLGRQGDLMKLDLLVSGVAEIFGPQAVGEYVNAGTYIQRRATALGIDTQGLIRSEDEVQAARQQAMQAEATKSAMGPGISAMKDMALKQAEMQAEPQPE